MADPVEPVDVLLVDGDRVTRAADRVAAEVPLEVRLQGEPFAIIMRTPGADLDLAAGFLLSEGVLRHAADLARAESTDSPDIVNLRVAPHRAEAASEFLGQRR